MIKSISPQNYLIAMDSFKGSLSSLDAANAVKAGILNADPDAEVVVSPLADGGEGTVNALTYGMNGNLQSAVVTDPYGNSISCEYGIAEFNNSNESRSKVAKT
ncbi:MAG: glycerate kinase, partial [Eubacterium sp.]|nr:glycerate kinase [Eubacterium sp.]